MHHLFRYALTLLILILPLYTISLWWRVDWISTDAGTRASLRYGRFEFWHGSPGDWSTLQSSWRGPYGLRGTKWNTEFRPMHEITVINATPIPGVVANRSSIFGLSLRFPLWIPLAIAFTMLTISARPWFLRARTASRLRRGRCTACGYDLTGLTGRCPECGTSMSRVVRWLRLNLWFPPRHPQLNALASPYPARIRPAANLA